MSNSGEVFTIGSIDFEMVDLKHPLLAVGGNWCPKVIKTGKVFEFLNYPSPEKAKEKLESSYLGHMKSFKPKAGNAFWLYGWELMPYEQYLAIRDAEESETVPSPDEAPVDLCIRPETHVDIGFPRLLSKLALITTPDQLELVAKRLGLTPDEVNQVFNTAMEIDDLLVQGAIEPTPCACSH
ncbi:hypothetical protein [Neptuniibacter sp. QD37_11]|uniref:hypothetical protein n=1 Tax=Neptuniibacter sp. QD37_11 TaxID=3398209 RepID=UPI0039F57F8F